MYDSVIRLIDKRTKEKKKLGKYIPIGLSLVEGARLTMRRIKTRMKNLWKAKKKKKPNKFCTIKKCMSCVIKLTFVDTFFF